jgi:hypothetical protein
LRQRTIEYFRLSLFPRTGAKGNDKQVALKWSNWTHVRASRKSNQAPAHPTDRNQRFAKSKGMGRGRKWYRVVTPVRPKFRAPWGEDKVRREGGLLLLFHLRIGSSKLPPRVIEIWNRDRDWTPVFRSWVVGSWGSSRVEPGDQR